MISRAGWVGVAIFAMLTAASSCLAAEQGATPVAGPASGPLPGRGGIGGLLGVSNFIGEQDYSSGAQIRLAFGANWRYQFARNWRWQISPGFTWAGYSVGSKAPFADLNFPTERTKDNYLTLMIPISAEFQFTWGKLPRRYHAGAGPGIYRVWIENHRKVLKDPTSFDLHRGVYLGGSAEIGGEQFLKALPNTSVELSLIAHRAFATRNDEFPNGFNSNLTALELRFGGNYYFDLKWDRKKSQELP